MVGVSIEGVVAVDEEIVVEGLRGSLSSRFFGRREDRNIFFRPARARKLVVDLVGVLGIAKSETGDTG